VGVLFVASMHPLPLRVFARELNKSCTSFCTEKMDSDAGKKEHRINKVIERSISNRTMMMMMMRRRRRRRRRRKMMATVTVTTMSLTAIHDRSTAQF
jgi:hypothetical protein